MEVLKNGNEVIYLNEKENIELYYAIEKKSYKIIKELKNDKRSLVLYIETETIPSKKIVLKIPKEKNSRKWQRFLSIFRGSESKREFLNCEFILESGFLGAVPLVAVEKKHGILVVDSYFVLTFINGKHAGFENISLALETLYKIHDKGYTHGDSQLPNFIINGQDVYLIDCKLKKIHFGILSKIKEFIYFEKSCHRDVESKYKKNSLYNLMKKIDIYVDKFNYFTKKIRGKS